MIMQKYPSLSAKWGCIVRTAQILFSENRKHANYLPLGRKIDIVDFTSLAKSTIAIKLLNLTHDSTHSMGIWLRNRMLVSKLTNSRIEEIIP
jgi:hypothetical protein